jgi:hypothetical protein
MRGNAAVVQVSYGEGAGVHRWHGSCAACSGCVIVRLAMRLCWERAGRFDGTCVGRPAELDQWAGGTVAPFPAGGGPVREVGEAFPGRRTLLRAGRFGRDSTRRPCFRRSVSRVSTAPCSIRFDPLFAAVPPRRQLLARSGPLGPFCGRVRRSGGVLSGESGRFRERPRGARPLTVRRASRGWLRTRYPYTRTNAMNTGRRIPEPLERPFASCSTAFSVPIVGRKTSVAEEALNAEASGICRVSGAS